MCYFERFPIGREEIFSQEYAGAVLVSWSPDEWRKFLGLIAPWKACLYNARPVIDDDGDTFLILHFYAYYMVIFIKYALWLFNWYL